MAVARQGDECLFTLDCQRDVDGILLLFSGYIEKSVCQWTEPFLQKEKERERERDHDHLITITI